MPQFSVAFLDSGIINGSCENFEDCSNICHSACTDILDSVAPLRLSALSHCQSHGSMNIDAPLDMIVDALKVDGRRIGCMFL